MRLCRPDKQNRYCIACGWEWKYPDKLWPPRNCDGTPDLRPAAGQLLGPGDWLHVAILKWVGEGPTRKCGCEDRINQMNAWGPEGCREHLDEIVGWMEGEAKKHGWWKYAVAVPIVPRLFIRQMILGAIEKTESNPNASRDP